MRMAAFPNTFCVTRGATAPAARAAFNCLPVRSAADEPPTS